MLEIGLIIEIHASLASRATQHRRSHGFVQLSCRELVVSSGVVDDVSAAVIGLTFAAPRLHQRYALSSSLIHVAEINATTVTSISTIGSSIFVFYYYCEWRRAEDGLARLRYAVNIP